MHIYVLGEAEHGKLWLEDPKPWFNGSLMLMFDNTQATAGVLMKNNRKPLTRRLMDELDQSGVLWSYLRNPHSGLLTLGKKAHQFFLMHLDLIGPLPRGIAEQIECSHRRKSLGLRQSVRYGG